MKKLDFGQTITVLANIGVIARLSTGFALSLAWTHASGQDLSPATFGDHSRSLTYTVLTPYDRPPGYYDASVTCQTIVEIDGSTTYFHCLSADSHDSFRNQVLAALSDAIMEPAKIDGAPVRVLMNFMVGFACREICSILFFENHGRHMDEFGYAYTAPQPVLSSDEWYRGFPEKLAWAASGRNLGESGGVKFVVSTNVDENGRSFRRRVEHRSSDYWIAASRAARSLDDVRYVPAFSNGHAIELKLYEYWFDPDGRFPEEIALPVRVHLLGSEFVDSLDSTLAGRELEQFFDDVNSHWLPAGIRWQIESVVEIDAERQLAFRRIVDQTEDVDISPYAYDVFMQLCPRDTWLEGGWNVCFVREFPWVASHFGEGLVVVGEVDARGEPVQAFALARELGETLGALDSPRCTSRFLASEGGSDVPFEGACATTSMNEYQINLTRRQAAKGYPSCPHPIRLGEAGGNWMTCALQAAPADHIRHTVPIPGTSISNKPVE
ncbi:MAG: hypothetical protein ACR2QQ_08265 [Gammaproteobacteria bacterium]